MRSEFQIRPRSTTFRSLICSQAAYTFLQPSRSVSPVRKTAASACITFCRCKRRLAVRVLPFALRSFSRFAIDASPSFSFNGNGRSPGLLASLIVFAHARPKTTMSSSEFAPSRFAPCTEAQATSPAAYRPGTTTSSLFFASNVITCPL